MGSSYPWPQVHGTFSRRRCGASGRCPNSPTWSIFLAMGVHAEGEFPLHHQATRPRSPRLWPSDRTRVSLLVLAGSFPYANSDAHPNRPRGRVPPPRIAAGAWGIRFEWKLRAHRERRRRRHCGFTARSCRCRMYACVRAAWHMRMGRAADGPGPGGGRAQIQRAVAPRGQAPGSRPAHVY